MPTKQQKIKEIQQACTLVAQRTKEEPGLGIEECLRRDMQEGCTFSAFLLNKEFSSEGKLFDLKFEESGSFKDNTYKNGLGIFYDVYKIIGQPASLSRILNVLGEDYYANKGGIWKITGTIYEARMHYICSWKRKNKNGTNCHLDGQDEETVNALYELIIK